MRRALRVLCVVGVWAAASLYGPAAEAQHRVSFTECSTEPTPTPSGEPTPPPGSPTPTPSSSPSPSGQPQNCVPASGSRLTGVQTLQFQVQGNQANRIKRVDLFVISEEEPGIPSPNNRQPVETWQYNEQAAPAESTHTFDWDTNTLTPHNGRYQVLVTAETYGQHTDPKLDSEVRRDLRVDNPPKAIAAPRIVATTPTTVSLEWDAATEPDVLEYKLYRANSSAADKQPGPGDFELVGTSTEPKKVDEVRGQEFYFYGVVVTRRSPVTPEQGISSPMSAISKPAEVKAEEPKPAGGGDAPKPTFAPRVVSKLPRLSVPRGARAAPPPVPDAPFSAVLPYDLPEGADLPEQEEPGGDDPRGPILPVAVGAFLVSSALTLGRMPY